MLNETANIGIKPIAPELNRNRIEGIINRVSNAYYFDDVAWILDEPVINFSQSIVDDSIRANAEFHANAGMSPKIVRKVAGSCCKWCREVAGTYYYPDVPHDVYRRHQRCRCTVDYNPGNGKVQNVHSKQWKAEEQNKKIEHRKAVKVKDDRRIWLNENVEDITGKTLNDASPGIGTVIKEEIEGHEEEISIANWLVEKFGGTVELIKESPIDGIKTPDFLWNKVYWEAKNVSTITSVDNQIHKAIKQLRGNNVGIVLDLKNRKVQQDKMVSEIIYRLGKRAKVTTNVIIKEDEELIKVIKTTKR